MATSAWPSGTSHHAARQSNGGCVERDQHAEADGDRRRAERQHQAGVEQLAEARRRVDRGRCQDPDGGGDHRRDDCEPQRGDERRQRVDPEPDAGSDLGVPSLRPRGQRPAVADVERTTDQRHDRRADGDARARRRRRRPMARSPRRARCARRGSAVQLDRSAALPSRRPHDHDRQQAELQHRQHRRAVDVAELGRPSGDLDLERRVRRPTEQLGHAERGEGEQEDDRRGRPQRRPQQRQRRSAARPAPARRRACAAAPTRSCGITAIIAPTSRTTTAMLKNTWATIIACAVPCHELGQQRQERRADHHGRQHERHGRHGQQQRVARGSCSGPARTRAAARRPASARC